MENMYVLREYTIEKLITDKNRDWSEGTKVGTNVVWFCREMKFMLRYLNVVLF